MNVCLEWMCHIGLLIDAFILVISVHVTTTLCFVYTTVITDCIFVFQWQWASLMTSSFHQSHFSSLQSCILSSESTNFSYFASCMAYFKSFAQGCEDNCCCSSSRAVGPSLTTVSVMKQSRCGCGSTRQMRGHTTSTWTKGRRYGLGSQTKSS